MRWIGGSVLAGMLLVCSGGAVGAQCTVLITNPPSGSCAQNTNVSLNVQAVARMTVGAFGGLGNPTITDYETGNRDAVGPTITVRANVPWSITIRGTTAEWSAANDPMSGDPARTTKPVGDLQWALVNGGPYTPLTSAIGGAPLSSGVATNETLVLTYFRSLWDFGEDTPGTYTLTVTFTIIAN